MSKIGKYIKEEYKLIIPFILTVINAQNLELYLRSVYASTPFIQSPYFLTVVISIDMLIATTYIFLTLWNRIRIETLKDIQISQDIVKYLQTGNGDLPDHKIICFDNLMKIESNVDKKKEIWILTENLDDDVSHPILSKVVEENIKKGVLYTYFLVNPKSNPDETLSFQRKMLEEKHKKHVNKGIKFVTIDDEMLVVPETYIILYNANSSTKMEGYLAVEIGKDKESYSYQLIESLKLHPIYNYLSDKKKMNSSKILPSERINEQVPVFAVNIGSIAIVFDILYLFFTVIILNAIKLPKISSLETLFQIMLPSLIIIFFASISIYIIDKLVMYNRNSIDKILEANKIYSGIIEGKESVTNELENTYLSKRNETENKMKLIHLEQMYSCNSSYKGVYMLTNIPNEILSDSFIAWINKLIEVERNVQITLVIPDDNATFSKYEYIREISHTNKENITIKRIASTNLFSLNPFDIYFMAEKDINDSCAYIRLGTEDSAVLRIIDKTYSNTRFRSQILGRIRRIMDDFTRDIDE